MSAVIKSTALKAKAHAVTIGGTTYLVMAQTKAGAIRDVVAILADDLRKDAHCDLATGEQLYEAGRDQELIINSDRYKRTVDPNQLGLTGIPETAGPLA